MTAFGATRHTAATRTVILAAAVELFLERRGNAFSVQEVADRAGLTHRTVYRYFPTRQELLAATARHLAPGIAEDPFIGVSTIEEWIDEIGDYLAGTEDRLDMARGLLAAVLSSDDLLLMGQGMVDRDSHRWEIFRRHLPHLPDGDARQTFSILRHLMSSTSYVFFRLRFGMSPTEATEAIQHGAVQLVEQATLRDRAAVQGRRDGPEEES